MTRFRVLALVATAALATAPLGAQQPAAGLTVQPSGRATAQVAVVARRQQGAPAPTPMVVKIDYGQPHARGRAVAGGLVPYDQVWRTGANEATAFTTEVDLEIAGTRVPKGAYTLYSLLTRSGWTLILNRQTGQWGTQYDQGQDLARVDLQTKVLVAPQESFSVTLMPAAATPAQGTLILSWGTLHGSVPWRVAP